MADLYYSKVTVRSLDPGLFLLDGLSLGRGDDGIVARNAGPWFYLQSSVLLTSWSARFEGVE